MLHHSSNKSTNSSAGKKNSKENKQKLMVHVRYGRNLIGEETADLVRIGQQKSGSKIPYLWED